MSGIAALLIAAGALTLAGLLFLLLLWPVARFLSKLNK